MIRRRQEGRFDRRDRLRDERRRMASQPTTATPTDDTVNQRKKP